MYIFSNVSHSGLFTHSTQPAELCFFTNVFVVFLTLYYCGNERFRDLKFNLSNFSVKSKQSKKVNGCVLYKTAKNVTFSNQWHIVKSASKWMKLLANERLWHKLYKGKRKVGIFDNQNHPNTYWAPMRSWNHVRWRLSAVYSPIKWLCSLCSGTLEGAPHVVYSQNIW